jgi:YegS/Rv2252/BmrU family lipid kinase
LKQKSKEKPKQKLLFVINPKSGNKENKELEELIDHFTVRYNYEYKILETTGENDKQAISESLDEYRPDGLITVGGDGTINLAASVLIDRDISLGIIPSGSANGLAYNLGLPKDTRKALERCFEGHPRPVDVIRINNNSNCLHLSDIGINARIVKRFEEEGSRGLAGYAKQLFKELFSEKSTFKFTISYDSSEYRMKAEMLVIANASAFGTGAIINPRGEMNDGIFEIIIIKPYPWWYVFKLIQGFFTGNFENMRYVDVLSVQRAHIELDKAMEMQIDGEITESLNSIDLKILTAAVKVLY